MKKQLLVLLLSLVVLTTHAFAQDPAPPDDPPIKVDTLLLTIPLTVSDGKGRNIPGLKKENFSIFQDGDQQDIEFFFSDEAPMNVAILIDASSSTKEVLDNIQKAARDFVKVFRPEDKGLIATFDYRTAYLSDLTSDRKKLTKAIDQIQIADRSGSYMHDAVFHIVQNHFASFKGRKAVIVLTDGVVFGREFSTQQILNTLQKHDTLFYPIVFKTKFNAAAMNSRRAKPLPIQMLEFLAEESAGRFYEKDGSGFKEAFQSISAELKKQYLLGFYPQNSGPGKSLGHIRVAVEPKEYTIRTKKTAFLPSPSENVK